MYQYFQENPRFTGNLQHIASWATSSNETIIIRNPRFKGGPGTAIYCVHGTADHNKAFSLIADRILDKLPDTIAAIYLPVFVNRFRGYGIEHFSEQLGQIIQANQNNRVILLGHSRGGLVAAWFAETVAPGLNIHVEKVISIGSPFMGSPAADSDLLAAFSESVSQMKPNSDFLKDLRSRMQGHPEKYHYFAAVEDILVPPICAVIPQHANSLIFLDKHDHLSIMSSHRLVNHIASIVRGCSKQPDLKMACEEIDHYLQNLQKRGHINDSTQKIVLLQKLQTLLQSMDTAYPDTPIKTVGALIHQFCMDSLQGNGQKPFEIFNTALNYPFSLLQPYNAATFNFVFHLIFKYKNVPLNALKAFESEIEAPGEQGIVLDELLLPEPSEEESGFSI